MYIRVKSRAGASSLLQNAIGKPGRLLEIPISSPSADSILELVLFQTFWIVTEDSMKHYCFRLLKVAIKYTVSRCYLANFLERYKRKKLIIRGKEFIVKALSSSLTTICWSLYGNKCLQSEPGSSFLKTSGRWEQSGRDISPFTHMKGGKGNKDHPRSD